MVKLKAKPEAEAEAKARAKARAKAKEKARPTLNECKASAAPFETRTAWNKAKSRYYKEASKHGWRDDCCDHMNTPVRKNRSSEILRNKALARKYNTRTELLHGSPYLYNYILNHGCMDELFLK